jgi:thiamine pyrophosphokinase
MTTFRRLDRVLLVAANGVFPSAESLKRLVERADRIVACDGGSDRLRKAGFQADLVVGDMDSISRNPLPKKVRVVRIEEQDSTDLEKVLRVLGIRALASSIVYLVGLTGLRSDFTLYNLHLLGRYAGLRFAAVDDFFYMFPVRDRFRLGRLVSGRGVSFLPLERTKIRKAEGFAYPLTGLRLEPGGLESVSNRIEGTGISLDLSSGRGILFVDKAAFGRSLPWGK